MTQLTLALELITFICVIITMTCLFKARQREAHHFQQAMNLFLFSMFLLLVTLFFTISINLRETFHILILPVGVITQLQPLYELILYPLFGMSLFVSILLIKEKL